MSDVLDKLIDALTLDMGPWFYINGVAVYSYTYDEHRERITFYNENHESICDIELRAKQWNKQMKKCKTEEEFENWIADLFGDAEA